MVNYLQVVKNFECKRRSENDNKQSFVTNNQLTELTAVYLDHGDHGG